MLPQIDLKTDRTNPTNKGREEATPKKVGSAVIWFREKWITGATEGGEPWSQRKVREQGAQRGTHKENFSPKPLTWKTQGLTFESPYNQWGLRPGVLKATRLVWDRTQRHSTAPGEKAGKQPRGKQHGNSDLKTS